MVEQMTVRRALLFAVTLALAACNDYPSDQVPVVPSESAAPDLYRPDLQKAYEITPGDSIIINSYYHPELKQTLTIQPDGKLSLMLVGQVTAAGKTPAQLARELTRAYAKFLNDAEMTVSLSGVADRPVYVGGEVVKPSVLTLKGQLTLTQSITEAGGFQATANRHQVLILRQTPDHHFRAMQADADLILNNEANEIYLHGHDVVFVPKTKIAKVATFIDQYINQIIPKQVGVGFGYSLGGLGTTAVAAPTSSNVAVAPATTTTTTK